MRVPRHIGLIPDGNRRWAQARGLPRHEGYRAGVQPGTALLVLCRTLGIAEVSIYGYTKENVHRPTSQVKAFRSACVRFAQSAIETGAALLTVGDTGSPQFPDVLRASARQRTGGDIAVNLLINYGWQWDLECAGRTGTLGSANVSRIDLVVRWGGQCRLSGFLPFQSAYADICILDGLWPDAQPSDLTAALAWYADQDITLGG